MAKAVEREGEKQEQGGRVTAGNLAWEPAPFSKIGTNRLRVIKR